MCSSDLDQLAMVAVDATNAVPGRDELSCSPPRLCERDELALLGQRGVAADVRELPHAAGADEPDAELRGHGYQSATPPPECRRLGRAYGL